MQFKCCAVDGYLDWTNATYKAPFPTSEGYKVPESCCAAFSASSLDLKNCQKDPQNFIYKDYMDGCLFEFKSSLGKNKESVKLVTATIILFMVNRRTAIKAQTFLLLLKKMWLPFLIRSS